MNPVLEKVSFVDEKLTFSEVKFLRKKSNFTLSWWSKSLLSLPVPIVVTNF